MKTQCDLVVCDSLRFYCILLGILNHVAAVFRSLETQHFPRARLAEGYEQYQATDSYIYLRITFTPSRSSALVQKKSCIIKPQPPL